MMFAHNWTDKGLYIMPMHYDDNDKWGVGHVMYILWIKSSLDQCFVLTSERKFIVSSCGVSKLFEFSHNAFASQHIKW